MIVFSVSTKKHAKYQLAEMSILFKKYVLRKDVVRQKPLYEFAGHDAYSAKAGANAA